MAVVSETLDLPGGSTPARCAVVIQLAGSDGVPLGAGYGSVAGTTIVGEHVVFSDESTGVWTVDLPRNDQITPSGTAWKVTLKGRGMSATEVPIEAAFAEACRLLGEAQVRESFYKQALAAKQPPPDEPE